jgi:hypothetical protein
MLEENEFILMKTLQTVIQEPIHASPEFVIPHKKSSRLYLLFCFLLSLPVYMFLMILSKFCFLARILKE